MAKGTKYSQQFKEDAVQMCIRDRYYYYDNWYYFNSSGIMQKDWVYDTDSWYYLDPTYGLSLIHISYAHKH